MNCLDEPDIMAGPKPMLTEIGTHQRLESSGQVIIKSDMELTKTAKLVVKVKFIGLKMCLLTVHLLGYLL